MNKKQELKIINGEIEKIKLAMKKYVDAINCLEEKKNEIYKELQKECKHPVKSIYRLLYGFDNSGYGDHEPEYRVCSICGYSEEGKATTRQGVYEFEKLNGKVENYLNSFEEFHNMEKVF